jgi:hypothetical protein
MSLLLASVIAANVVPVAEIDLASTTVYISDSAREAVDAGTVQRFVCFDLPERSRKFRSACLTSTEWQLAVAQTKRSQRRARTSEEIAGLMQQPVPIHNSLYQSTSGPR